MSLSFDTLLDPQAVCLGVEAKTPEQVISQLAEILERKGYVAPTYAPSVIAREATMPTGLPLSEDFAVAMPHTDAVHVLKPGIAIATLAHPVPFGNMEDPDEVLPVRIVFVLALNDKHAQIGMLQTIASLLQTPDRLNAIAAASSAKDVLDILRDIKVDGA